MADPKKEKGEARDEVVVRLHGLAKTFVTGFIPVRLLARKDAGGVRLMRELRTPLALTRCRACGAPFAAAKQLAGLRGRTAVPVETLETCPDCRRALTGRRAKTGVLTNAACETRGTGSCQKS